MFGKRIELFKLFGFSVRIDLSWLVIAVLITWSLASGWFPQYDTELSQETYWWMGVAGTLGLFASIIFHEMSHSLIARRFGLPMKGITLFIFGGVAEMDEEPPSAKAEFWMAVAGPAASAVLVGLFALLTMRASAAGWPEPMHHILHYLATINAVLIVFNSIPAFPLDGGRVLRAGLWHWKRDLSWATRTSSQVGSMFGIMLIVLGVFAFLSGNFVGGMWWALIGLFVRSAATMSYQRLLVRQALEGEPVRRFMTSEPVTAPPGISVQELVDDYVYHHHYKMLPVVENERLLGCVSTRQIREVPRESWNDTSVRDLASDCSQENTVRPDADAMQALAQMSRSGVSRLMVVDDGRLVGVLSLKDLLGFLSLKVELEGDGDGQELQGLQAAQVQALAGEQSPE